MEKALNYFSTFNLTKVWIIFFVYSTGISVLIQFLILPVFLPQFHMGHGLLDGGDWTFYHTKAVEFSNLIKEHGWSYWQLKPDGFGLIGFVSLIYSFFGIFEPYVLIPFFSLLHSLGATCIVLLIEKLDFNRGVSFFSAIPFLIFPSSLLWVSQILKDIFTINGSLIILLGLTWILNISKSDNFSLIFKKLLVVYLLILLGFILIWIVRPYFVEISLIFVLLSFVTINLFLIFKIFLKKNLSILNMLLILLTQFFLIISVNYLPQLKGKNIDVNSILKQVPSPVFNEQQIGFPPSTKDQTIKIAKFVPDTNTKTTIKEKKIEEYKDEPKQEEVEETNIIEFKDWYPSSYLPTRIDNEFKKLYYQRSYFYSIQHGANSTFDFGTDLNSFKKLVKYVPRAIQVGLFSPFPSSWFAEHSSQLSKLMHFITGMEMIFMYICFVGLAISLFIWKKKVEFWMFVCFSFYFTLIPIYAIPNIGALVRYRYGAIMLLVAIGISAFLKLYKLKIENDKNDFN